MKEVIVGGGVEGKVDSKKLCLAICFKICLGEASTSSKWGRCKILSLSLRTW